MTREEYKEKERLHKELWSWLAETGRDKWEWPGWERNGGEYYSNDADCFACDVLFDLEETTMEWDNTCERFCPISDGSLCNSNPHNDERSLFYNWNETENLKEAKNLAAQIRDLPWKPYEELFGNEKKEG